MKFPEVPLGDGLYGDMFKKKKILTLKTQNWVYNKSAGSL
jgi:hypothetical protein